MLRNMTNSLLKHEVIKTTLLKAKALRKVVAEPIITLGRKPRWPTAVSRTIVCVIATWLLLFDELGPALQSPQWRLLAHPQVRLPPKATMHRWRLVELDGSVGS